MKSHYNRALHLVNSETARNTYTLFIGNVFSAFWGFLFMVVLARSLSISELGIFTAVINLVGIIVSLSDVGISTGAINFVSKFHAVNDTKEVNRYIKAAFLICAVIIMALSLLIIFFSTYVSKTFLASTQPEMAIWVAIISIFYFPIQFFPSIFLAQKRFITSTLLDNLFHFSRFLVAILLFALSSLTLNLSFITFGISFSAALVIIIFVLKLNFLKAKPSKDTYIELLKFSRWMGVSRIISSVSGRLDITMLAAIAGATATGFYSIPLRLASFISVLATSFSSVLATRMAAIDNKEEEKAYLLKSTLALIPITGGIILWIITARPFIVTLFGDKFLPSVPVFQALAASMIPYVLNVPAGTAVVYAMKKTVYIGAFSFFQLIAIFILNSILIPIYGPVGPAFVLFVVNAIYAIYSWTIVIRHYWTYQ